MPPIRYSAGSYVGNGADNRNIVGFYLQNYSFLMVVSGTIWSIRTKSMVGDFSQNLSGSGTQTNRIQSVTFGTHFQVGSSLDVNNNGIAYRWIAFSDDPLIVTGSYTGDGLADKLISTPGITPVFVLVVQCDGGSQSGVWRTNQQIGDLTFVFNSNLGGVTNRIKTLVANGFTVGTTNQVNASGSTYHFIAFGTDTSKIAVGSYVGDNADNRNIIITPNIAPVWVMDKRQSSANNNLVVTRHGVMAGDETSQIGSGYSADMLQALQVNGFQVGTLYAVNGNDGGGAGVNTYFWAAITALLQDPDPTAGFAPALPIACGHSLLVNPITQE